MSSCPLCGNPTSAEITKALRENPMGHTMVVEGDWRTPATPIPKRRIGDYRIRKANFSQKLCYMQGVAGYRYYTHDRDVVYTKLQQRIDGKWKTWMVDSPVEWYGEGEFASRTRRGNVLVGGLGLGLYLHQLASRMLLPFDVKDVEGDFFGYYINHVIVAEISKEVIELVEPFLPMNNRIRIINDDFFNVLEKCAKQGVPIDTVQCDFWAFSEEEGRNDGMKTFKRAYKRISKLYPDALQLHWGFHYLVDKWKFDSGVINGRLSL